LPYLEDYIILTLVGGGSHMIRRLSKYWHASFQPLSFIFRLFDSVPVVVAGGFDAKENQVVSV